MLSFFFLSVTSHCVSTLEICFHRNLLLEFIRFLQNHYNGFTIRRLSNLSGPKFSWQVISAKFQFSDFSEDRGFIFESCLYSKLGNCNGFPIIDGAPFSWPIGYDIFYHYVSVIFVKKAEFFGFFRNKFDIPHCPLRFPTFALLYDIPLMVRQWNGSVSFMQFLADIFLIFHTFLTGRFWTRNWQFK